jgi:FkbM family methyltransferase
MPLTVPPGLFKFINRLERVAAFAQGKGYGTATMRQEVTLLQGMLRAQPTLAIDIGGNVGHYTAELRRRNPSLEIHTFEPSATNLEKLRARFKNDGLITLVPLALSASAGSAILHSDEPGSGLGSLSKRNLEHHDIAFDTQETIQTARFEDYWTTKLQSRLLDMVKIDIEGHELSALRGFGKALEFAKVVQFEFGGCNIDTRTYFQDFWYFLRERNFDIYRITPLGAERITRYRESEECFLTTNYIAANCRWTPAAAPDARSTATA